MRILRVLPLVCLLAALPMAAKPRLVPIANAAIVAPQSSNPGWPLKVGSQIFFAANDGLHGNEPWRSDGTAAGTYMLKDIGFAISGSDPLFVGALGNDALFQVSDASTRGSLWRSDGTVAGTVQIFRFPDLAPMNNGGYYVSVIPADSKAYIVVQQNYGGPNDLWVTDGTAAGTQRIGSFGLSGSAAFGANGKLYFPAGDDTVGTQFWVSDGTIPGTHMIQRSKECPAYTACGPLPTSFFRIGAQVYFGTATDGLWKTDGTPQGTAKVVQLVNPYLYAGSATVAYLISDGKLWKTNGTAAGTTSTESEIDYALVDLRVLDDGRLLYVRYGLGWDVWRSDGTPGGTLQIATLPLGSSSPGLYPVVPIVGVIGKRLFLSGWTAATGYELWLGDADTGSVSLLEDLDTRVTSTGPVSSAPAAGAEVGGKLLFAAGDLRGRELWESDGTTAGTKLLINIAPEPGGGFVSGTVRAAGTAAPIAGAAVRLCAVGSACESPTITDANGAYRFEGVIPGSYTLSAIRSGYVSQLYGGVQCPCPTTSTGTRITVSSGFETTGVDFALNPGGAISGTVTRLSDGAGVGAEVYILNQDFYTVERVYSSGTGGAYRSSSSLATGTYYVEVRPLGLSGPVNVVPQRFRGVDCGFYGCEGPGGEPVSVVAGSETSAINFPLNVYGSISGTVRDASNGTTLSGAQVEFIRANPDSGLYYPGATIITDADGRYQSALLNPGSYHVLVMVNGFPQVYYPNQVCLGCTPAATVTVSVNTNTSGIDFSLTPQRARLTGILRDSTGAPFPNVRVVVQPAVARNDFSWADTNTDANGRYTFGNLPSGSYHLWALDELYPHVDCSPFNYCDRTGATAVVATEGQTTTLDFPLLSRRVTISGRLLDATTGAPILDPANVSLYDQDQHSLTEGRTLTISDGNYAITAITRKTSFYVTASADGYRLTVYPAARMICPEYTTCPFPADATLIPLSAPSSRDVRLARYGTISGTVYDVRTGNPLRSKTIQFAPTTAGRPAGYAYTDEAGLYRWDRAEGAYYAYTNDSQEVQGQVYPDRNCSTESCVPTTGNAINAPEGVDVTGIDFHLQERTPTGKVSGRVIDAVTGAGIANAYVQAYGTTPSSRSASARTDAQGYYTLENTSYVFGLSSGSYTLYVEAPGAYYLALYGGTYCADGSNCNRRGGTPVSITAPNTTTNINFQMIRLTLTAVSPAEGSVAGGTSITISGANFTQQSTVKIGGRPATITSITPTQIVALTPVSLEGPAHVTVTLSPGLFSSLAHAFTYTPVTFTDPTLAALTRLKRAHIDELRSAIKYLRTAAALPAFTYTDPTLTGKPVRAIHLLELRTALDEARTALGRSRLTYTNPLTPLTTKIKAVDVIEIRNGIR
jgi:ELWxxDGT repeat protein